ncbi:MAG TPA: hypothetical protein VEY51_19720, partial [Chondromyces sp.]|nr:hypothetical protein [Chondromyces sp.]
MDNQKWEEFIRHWEQGNYEKAVELPIEEKRLGKKAVINQLFRSPDIDSKAVVSLSFVDVLYDYLMIDPSVIHAVDFARKEDLSNLFSFQLFAKDFDFSSTGEITRLKGYTAEHLVALELQGKGHDVEFPDSAFQKGYDLLVDGKEFQVKCLSTAGGVHEHLRKYPDIPVLVNKELAEKFKANPLVYETGVSNEIVEKMTKSSLSHAAELTDLDIPLITIGISTLKNGYKVIAKGLDVKTAGLNVANELGARGAGGLAGKGVGLLVGPLLGPAGVVILPVFFGMAGAYGGKKLTGPIKKLYTQKERKETLQALSDLIEVVLGIIPQKAAMREANFDKVMAEVNNHS